MSIKWSLADGQGFFMSGTKPPRRFWERAPAPLMAAAGWKGEWLLTGRQRSAASLTGIVLCRAAASARFL